MRDHLGGLSALAQQPQDDPGGVADRIERTVPALEVPVAGVARAVQPVMVRGQVELAGAARDRRALLDCHQPVVLAQRLADLAGHREKPRMRMLHVAQHAGEDFLVDVRVGAVRGEHAALPVELLQQVGLEVRPARDLHDLEEREQRRVMLHRVGALEEEARPVEEVLEPQHRADALDQRIFVSDHAFPGAARDKQAIFLDSPRIDNTIAARKADSFTLRAPARAPRSARAASRPAVSGSPAARRCRPRRRRAAAAPRATPAPP